MWDAVLLCVHQLRLARVRSGSQGCHLHPNKAQRERVTFALIRIHLNFTLNSLSLNSLSLFSCASSVVGASLKTGRHGCIGESAWC